MTYGISVVLDPEEPDGRLLPPIRADGAFPGSPRGLFNINQNKNENFISFVFE
jgi:hypothetical protein